MGGGFALLEVASLLVEGSVADALVLQLHALAWVALLIVLLKVA